MKPNLIPVSTTENSRTNRSAFLFYKDLFLKLLTLATLLFFCVKCSLGQISANHTIIENIGSTADTLTCGTIEPETAQEITIPDGFKLPQVITIPVVFHVVWNTPQQNIPDAQLIDQLNALNRDFRRLNADTTNAPLFNHLGADIEVEFCLATIDPSGNPTTGITRTQTATTCFSTNNAVKFNSSGGKDIWNRDHYLNIWVAPLCSNLGGYAQFPCQTASTDGVVNIVTYTGQVGGVYGLGRIGVHEVGHWLGLYHTFQGGCASNDWCADTPPTGQPNYGCPSTTGAAYYDACSPSGNGVMYQNYMDYTFDPCKSIFTQDQKTRVINTLMGCRASLLTSPGCGSPSVVSIDSAKNTNMCTGEYAEFVTSSLGCTWSAPGASFIWGASTSTCQVQYNVAGNYKVYLNGAGSDSVSITVQNCAKIPHIYTNWLFPKELQMQFLTTGATIAGHSLVQGIESCASISDQFGNLVCSTDGKNFWDNNHNLISSTMIGWQGGSSTSQCLILPSRTTLYLYHIFVLTTMNNGVNNGLAVYEYNALTKTLSAVSFPPVNFPRTEGITAVPDCNNSGWQIITHGKEFSGSTPNWSGVDVSDKAIVDYFEDGAWGAPVLSQSFDVPTYGYGQYKASPDGDFVAMGETSTGRVELYSINRQTRQLTFIKFFNAFTSTMQSSGYGLSFSPDGTKLYTTGGFSIVAIKCLVQWEISTSQMTILNCTGWNGQLQLGPDNKIYVSPQGQKGLGVINLPNAYGLGCNYVANQVSAYLPIVKSTMYGLPNNVDAMGASVGWCNTTPLPVKLLEFTGYKKDKYNIITWITATEKDNDYFTLYRSYDVQSWEPITIIKGAGNSPSPITYQYLDYGINRTAYYRLHQTDIDGTETQEKKILAIHIRSQEKITGIFTVEYKLLPHTDKEALPPGYYFIQYGQYYEPFIKTSWSQH